MICTHKICSGDQITNKEMGGACSTYGERRCAYGVLVGKTERKRPLGRPGNRWEDNITIDLQERDWGMDWIDLPQDTKIWRDFMNELMNLVSHKMRGIF